MYLVFTTNEELGGAGGAYARANLPRGPALALEDGPPERRYPTIVPRRALSG